MKQEPMKQEPVPVFVWGKALWQFISYLFWSQWGKKRREEHTHDAKNAGQSH